MHNRVYPFSRTLKNALRTIEAPSIGVRLIDLLMHKLELTQSELEVLIAVASYRSGARVAQVHGITGHLSPDAIKTHLLRLASKDLVRISATLDANNENFTVTQATLADLGSITIGQLEGITPENYYEAIVDLPADEPVSEDVAHEVPSEGRCLDVIGSEVFDFLEVLKLHHPDVAASFARGTGGVDWVGLKEFFQKPIVEKQKQEDYPRIPLELELSMGFLYTLVAPGQNASDIIAKNPERAAKAHKAIYYRRPQAKSYEEMMASIPATPPAPKPAKKGLIEMLVAAFEAWRNQ